MKLISYNFKNMDKDLWRRMKVVAAREDVTLREFLMRAISEAVDKYDNEPFHKKEKNDAGN